MARSGTYRGWKVYRMEWDGPLWGARMGDWITATYRTYRQLCHAIDRGERYPADGTVAA